MTSTAEFVAHFGATREEIDQYFANVVETCQSTATLLRPDSDHDNETFAAFRVLATTLQMAVEEIARLRHRVDLLESEQMVDEARLDRHDRDLRLIQHERALSQASFEDGMEPVAVLCETHGMQVPCFMCEPSVPALRAG